MMKPAERSRVVRQHKYCLNCLAKSHTVTACHSTNNCRKCRNYHHTLLHPEHPIVKPPIQARVSQSQRQNPQQQRQQQGTNRRQGQQRNNNQPGRQHNSNFQSQQVLQTTINKARKRKVHKPNTTARRGHQQYMAQQSIKPNANSNVGLTMPDHHILSDAIRSIAAVLCSTYQPVNI